MAYISAGSLNILQHLKKAQNFMLYQSQHFAALPKTDRSDQLATYRTENVTHST